jgi:hypothetical protein
MSMRFPAMVAAALFSMGAVLLIGCRSAVSTHVVPDPFEGGWKTERMRGIPVTVKVPTHLEVRVIERRYYAPKTFELFHTALIVEHEMREKDQVFTVDSVRPAAGGLTYSAKLENKLNPQFFSKFDTKIEDETIKDIAPLIPNLPDILTNLKKASAVSLSSGNVPTVAGNVVQVDSVVAVKVFDVHDPGLSACVQAFLDQYVNACAPPCPTPVCTSPACVK